MNIALVIPTIRDLTFLSSWNNQFKTCDLFIIEDHAKKEITIPKGIYKSIHHYDWSDIQNDFGKNEWIFSRQNAGIRSYGFWKAYKSGADIIITIDDDCYPVDRDFVKRHEKNLSLSAPVSWTTTYPHPDFLFTRGVPYRLRNKQTVVISHGLWTNQIDLDAQTQKKLPPIDLPPYPPMLQFIPKGLYYPMCSMNLAFRRNVTPLMYFPLMGKAPDGSSWGFDRFDDIWAGIFAKKIIDHLGLSAVNGSPFVEHRKASDIAKNLKKEKRGIAINEILWKLVDDVHLTKRTPAACYTELAEKIKFPNTPYFLKLKKAMKIWAKVF